MLTELKDVLSMFQFDAPPVSCKLHGHGHINRTYLVITESSKRYILQKINHHVFKNVPRLMDNVIAVTEHLHKKASNPNRVLHLVHTVKDEMYLHHTDGTFWRVYDYIENSVCLEAAETPNDFYQSAVAFGQFQQDLKDFPAETLFESIPNFHNTPDRFRIFKEVLAKDPMGRAASVKEEIAFALAREEAAGELVTLLEEGKLPLRVTHNDTKLNNVMLDATTREPLCVMDLDTVMPGLSAYDFGDSIRFGAAVAAEDEQDLNKVEMSLELFETYTKGYISACPDMTEMERKVLPLGAKTITLELGLRFLTDYLDGDHYFTAHREGQNLDRCRTQFKLVADMEKKWDEMNRIVAEA